MSHTPIVRFAPSPTGYLHVGNIRTALVNYLFAKQQGGEFHLRMDDTDAERSKPEYEAAIKEDLTWLGMEWSDYSRQRDRFANYEAAKEKLIAAGRLYPCWETQDELDVKRKMLISRGQPPIYDRGALKLSDDEKQAMLDSGKQPHYRFLLEDTTIAWKDLIRGDVKFEGNHMSDPVLIRADGVPLYTFCSVVDDIEFHTTHILRGEDHVSNTAVQTQIFMALGGDVPTFGHMALLKTKEGELSKRKGGGDIRSLRAEGIEAMAVNSLLAKIGTSDAIDIFPDMEALIASFDISKFGRAAANYDPKELERLNAKLTSTLPWDAVKDQLPQADAEFWEAVRPNVATVAEAKLWLDIIHQPCGEIAPEDAEFLAQASGLLPAGEWNDATWNEWTKAVAEITGRKGKTLFMPIRLALTGMSHGPELRALLPLLGREKTTQRLKGQVHA
ncbi:MAG: glutamate--tRNA ligase [Alphaproteobacteria bacterium]|nr:glutamate--tRNA ligase [Alphaproteobacteria bacterium]